MRVVPEVWLRPWALAESTGKHRIPLSAGQLVVPDDHRSALWLFDPNSEASKTNTRVAGLSRVAGFNLQGSSRTLNLMPMALRRNSPIILIGPIGETQIVWPNSHNRPPTSLDPKTPTEIGAHNLLLRAESVWDRLREVETAIADPANLWRELRRRWAEDSDDADPRMDIIVRQALELSRTLDELDRAPRRVLRRTHEMLPLARVQEMDRRAMNWLVRQPGETLAERAGDSQRVLAVVRRENFDTLENRVVRAYSELAGFVVRDYLERHARKRSTGRAVRVRDYGKRVKRLSRDFANLNIRSTEPGITPNFVLQQNPSYHAVWEAWQELLNQDQLLDDLWKWQAASWEEFCALALNVAIGTIPGARLIASSPLGFREEQQQGSWITHDNPLGVFYLPEQKVVIEIQFRVAERTSAQADLGTQLWVRFGHTDDPAGFHKYVPVWCLWDAVGGLVDGEVTEVATLLQRYRTAGVIGGLIIRPAPHENLEDDESKGLALGVSMAPEGPGLRHAVETVAHFITKVVNREIAR